MVLAASLLFAQKIETAPTLPMQSARPHNAPRAGQEHGRGCSGSTTAEIDNCLVRLATQSDANLQRYLDAARRRVSNQTHGTLPLRIENSEKSFEAYREAECSAVFSFWKSGTIRTSKELECRIRLTDARTHSLWKNWLTYPDSTPPILPEPAPTR